MGGQTRHESPWRLAARQHGVISRKQLLDLGFTKHAIQHRVSTGRLFPIHRAVFSVGRPELDLHGRCMAAVLACGPRALVSHETAAELWGIRSSRDGPIEISVPLTVQRSLTGVRLHRRRSLGDQDRAVKSRIPLTSPVRTLVDLAARLPAPAVEAAVNEADNKDRLDPEGLRRALEQMSSQPGVPALRRLLDRRTFRLTDSELERRFLRLVERTGLPVPQTGVSVNGFRVDFFWPELGLVVETDGLRYHRTPAQQAKDRRRDQVHTAAGLTTLRFTHAQVRYDSAEVGETLLRVAERLARRRTAA
jgi:very-short-patch-repair endonuclease